MAAAAGADILSVSFNQDATTGFRIYSVLPDVRLRLEAREGGIGLCEQLFASNLVILVGGGPDPAFSPRKLRAWNTLDGSSLCELNFVSAVLSVRLNYSRLVVVLERQLHVFHTNRMSVLQTLDTHPNPRGVVALTGGGGGGGEGEGEPSLLAYPAGLAEGDVLVHDAQNLQVLNKINAHQTPVAALAFNARGTMLATASETGTVIRLFAVPSGEKVASFRRGSYTALVHSLAFNAPGALLCAASETGTVHVFAVPEGRSRAASSASAVSSDGEDVGAGAGAAEGGVAGALTSAVSAVGSLLSSAAAALPASVSDVVEPPRAVAVARIRDLAGCARCAFVAPDKVAVVTSGGFFYRFAVDAAAGECRLECEEVLFASDSEEVAAGFYSAGGVAGGGSGSGGGSSGGVSGSSGSSGVGDGVSGESGEPSA